MIKKVIVTVITVLVIVGVLTVLLGAKTDYSDVPASEWYAGAVSYITSIGLLKGSGEDTFSPSEYITRANFVAMLGRYAGVNVDSIPAYGTITKTNVNMRSKPNTDSDILKVLELGTRLDVYNLNDGWFSVRYNGSSGYVRADMMSATDTQFKDIGFGTEYGAYVRWAHSSGILTGLIRDAAQAEFEPDSCIQREQICVMLYNYAIAAGIALPDYNEPALFPDDDRISSYAKTAVYAMRGAGVIGGYSDGGFIPEGNATRAEAAAIMSRFITVADEAGPVSGFINRVYADYQIFGNVVPASNAAPDSYFDDACFIGHSMVVGMSSYFSLPRADFFAVNGISAGGVLRHDGFALSGTRVNENGETVRRTGTIRETLGEKKYGKVYIMLGTNELGPETRHLDAYYQNLSSLIDIVKTKQPTASIYLISILPVSQSRSESSGSFNRENVISFNSKMMQVSLDKNVYYIDAFSEFADKEGYLPDSACAGDGIHILTREYARLKTFLKTHTA